MEDAGAASDLVAEVGRTAVEEEGAVSDLVAEAHLSCSAIEYLDCDW